MRTLIEANLDLCRVPVEQTEVVLSEAAEFLRARSRQNDRWDVVFFDPPYAENYLHVLESFGARELLAADGLLVIEHHRKNELPAGLGRLRRRRVLKQGDSTLSFYEAKESV